MAQYQFDFDGVASSPDAPMSITALTVWIRQALRENVAPAWVEGEVTDLVRASSGHVYFALKDAESQIRAVMWRSSAARMRFELKNGMAVICHGQVDVYGPRGTYQLIVDRAVPKGVGALQLALQQLRGKLEREGLFDPLRKRPLPHLPVRVGFVTSPEGAALHDFLEAARSRWPAFHLTVIPSRVQGDRAADELADGIRMAQRIVPRLDVLIVGRGGGSMEDLWPFNEEKVVRAMASSSIPTVSAVGHEVDVTLCDLVADRRALTPTDAAQVVFPSRGELQSRVRHLGQRASSLLRGRLEMVRQRLDWIAKKSVLARPHDIVFSRRQRLDELECRARQALWERLEESKTRLAHLVRATAALSPLGVLQRGYSVTLREQTLEPIRDATTVQPGEAITSIVARGQIVSRVESTSLVSPLDLDAPAAPLKQRRD
ncbi:MAG: exodeoxyribonuclease VII large subunit [Planctomycetota bacterium]|nr:MAG: exodeoxyribonuclease VII large subunit [Planctomycetota bacterium]